MRKTILCPQCHGIGWMFEDQAAATSAEVDALRAKVATLEAQLAAVTPWEIAGRVPTEEESAAVEAVGGAWLVRVDGTLETSTPGSPSFGWLEEGPWKCDLWAAVTHDCRPMPKPAHIP